ncbi:protein eva-1 homolog C isoform X3 [Bubalus bubalis]|uniref:protein eva-1 homolog C isoform X3 n=1 Tax=Bubalus bubalis TaxID=89462 RepID=UPI001E1B6B1F|nr:protein eva-1 homolog C isoform X3 [Bubalus bubalis]
MLLPGHARPPSAPQPAQHPGLRRQVEPPGQLLRLFYCTVLVCSREIAALTDFSGYLTKLLQNHTAYACDGDHLNLQCPRHSTISVQSAFYGQDYQKCSPQQPASQREDSLTCVVPTTLQKVLDECQNQRACHLLVNSRVFGPDLCPGSSKYLLVSFKCQPNELKNKTVCEDHELKLHCHESKFLNIYSATYGRRTQERHVCSSEAERLPHFDCLSYSALHVLSRRCYGKQRCKVLVNNHHFGSPCLPGVKKYLSVFYACVPKNILTAIDPSVANLKPSVKQKDGDYGVDLDPREPRVLRKDGVIVSHSLAAFAYIRDFVYSDSGFQCDARKETASLVASMVKRRPAVRETWDRALDGEDPLEKEMATHSGTLAWKIPWAEEPGGLPSMEWQRAGHD